MPIASSLLNKPRLVEKLRKFYDYVQKNDGKVGQKTRGIDLNFNNACNLRCKYCFTNSPKGDHAKEYLDIKAIKKLADEADELGYFEFDLQGGELLLQPAKLFCKYSRIVSVEKYIKIRNVTISIQCQFKRLKLTFMPVGYLRLKKYAEM